MRVVWSSRVKISMDRDSLWNSRRRRPPSLHFVVVDNRPVVPNRRRLYVVGGKRKRQTLPCKICQKVILTVNRYLVKVFVSSAFYSNILSEFSSATASKSCYLTYTHDYCVLESCLLMSHRVSPPPTSSNTFVHYWAGHPPYNRGNIKAY